jgi:hypothetical protein
MSARSPWRRSRIKAVGSRPWPAVFALAAALSVPPMAAATAQAQKPNIIVIMGDDIGWSNVGAYHQGLMYSTTPNLDQMASEGMRFTDYYAEPSCTAGRRSFERRAIVAVNPHSRRLEEDWHATSEHTGGGVARSFRSASANTKMS